MRSPGWLGVYLLCLSGCGGLTTDQVRDKIRADLLGKTVDQMVMRYGPPTASHTMSNGDKMLEWNLKSVVDEDGETQQCKVRALTNTRGVIQQVTVTDADSDTTGDTLCADAMGIK